MLYINQLKLKPGFSRNDLVKKVSAALKVLPEDIIDVTIDRRSLDARKRNNILYIVNAIVSVKREDSVLRRITDGSVSKYEPVVYTFPAHGDKPLKSRPIIVGAGPAGLFCAYYLAKNGYKPIVLERGLDVDSRKKSVERFWETGVLDPNSNVLFGEGGAGAFSDGKLNTLVKDKDGRNKEVLFLFVKYGAKPSILYDSKPHVGTDVLCEIVKSMREDIKKMGGEFRFNAEMTDIVLKNGRVKSVKINGLTELDCDILLLCIGHSARNTFSMLYDHGIKMEQKEFAVGFRVEHNQKFIDKAFCTDDESVLKFISPVSYKLTYKHESGRGVYSFCMCPGGYVVNASSENGRLCVNGMSYSGRSGEHANSAIIVSVGPKDFGSDHPLAGIEFQRKIEENAFAAGNGMIPVEHYGDFKRKVTGADSVLPDFGEFVGNPPCTKGSYIFADITKVLPEELNRTFVDAMEYFDKVTPGFGASDVLMSAVESRTSSPVRITRGDNFQSLNCGGLYPIGEGAGYAGGIMSAAMDGMKAAEAVAKVYMPLSE